MKHSLTNVFLRISLFYTEGTEAMFVANCDDIEIGYPNGPSWDREAGHFLARLFPAIRQLVICAYSSFNNQSCCADSHFATTRGYVQFDMHYLLRKWAANLCTLVLHIPSQDPHLDRRMWQILDRDAIALRELYLTEVLLGGKVSMPVCEWSKL